MIPTLRTTLGVTGHRPLVGHLDGHDVVDVFGALTLVTGQLTTRLVERLQKAKKPGTSKPRYVQAGFARHRRDIARTYPAAPYPHVVLVIDKTPFLCRASKTMLGLLLVAMLLAYLGSLSIAAHAGPALYDWHRHVISMLLAPCDHPTLYRIPSLRVAGACCSAPCT
jgi:hypothetical protein